MNRELTPESLGPPSANYSLATLSERPARILHTSGIGPVRPDGSVPTDLGEQAEVVWSTLLALLAEAELATIDVVSVTTYVVVGADAARTEDDGSAMALGKVMEARDAALAGHRCASTLVPVPRLASPTWRLEIALVAVGSA